MNKKMFFATNLAISLLFMSSSFGSPTNDIQETSDKKWVYRIYHKVKPLAPGIALIGGYVAWNYMLSNKKNPFSMMNTAQNLFGIMGGQYLASQLFVDPIKQAGNYIASEFFPNLLCSQDEIQILSMKKDMEQWFEEKKISENTYVNFFTYLPGKDDYVGNHSRKDAFLKACNIHKLAKEAKTFDWNEIQPKLNTYLKTFDEKIKKQITDTIREIVVAARLPNSEKTVICFHGEPGTGKTYLANKIAEVLGVSMTDFDARDLANGSRDLALDLFGHEKNNFKNNILFLDEFDKGLKNIKSKTELTRFLLMFLEKGKKNINSTSIHGLQVDISKAIIILACNELPEDEAIKSRMRIIEFSEVSKETQKTIAYNYFDELCKDNNFNFIPDEKILEKIVSQNDYHGVRIMKDIIYKYFSHIASQVVLNEETGTFDVKDAYSQYNDPDKSELNNLEIF